MYAVPNTAIKGIDSIIEQHGGDAAQLMQDVGFDPALLTEQGALIPGQLFNDLLEHTARQLNLRYLGLELAVIQGGSVLGSLWMLIRNAVTIGEALELLVANYAFHTELSVFSLEHQAKGTLLRYDAHTRLAGSHTQLIELGLAISCIAQRHAIAPHWQPSAVYLRASEPYDKRPLEQVFGEHLYFDQEVNGIFLTHAETALPIRQASVLQRQHYHHEQQKFIDFKPLSAVVQTENIINASLTRTSCSLNYVARCLGKKPRTLQYQLKQQGTSFQQLLQQAKLGLALRYLKQSTLSITDIAQRLQFAETAVFCRYIKKHTGLTPSQLRGN